MTRRHPLALAIIAMTALTATGCGDDGASSASSAAAADGAEPGGAPSLEEPLDAKLVDSVG